MNPPRAALVAIFALVLAGAGPAPPLDRSAPSASASSPNDAVTAPLLAAIDSALAAGRIEAARDLITRAGAGEDPKLRLRAAEVTLAMGTLPAAAAAFAELASDAGLGALALQGLGLARLRQGDLAAAIIALDAALARDPALPRAWSARGVAADRARDFSVADAAYARALALDSRSAATLTNRGYSRLLRGRHADAETDLAAALAIEPGLAVAATNLRFARALQGRYAEAFAGASPKGLPADLNTVGFAAMARGDIRVAETYFARALALNPRLDRTATANLAYLQNRITASASRTPIRDVGGALEGSR